MQAHLDGIKVLDIGRYIAGPYAATLLGYMGADVIRVERLLGGEDRFISPLSGTDAELGIGGLFMQTGCGKKCIGLNLKSDEGKTILHKLAANADIVIANLPIAALENLGLDWGSFKALNSKGILVTQSTFGSTGPGKHKGGFDGVGQALSGAMYLTGTPGKPVKAATPFVDYSTALISAFGALAALRRRDQTGSGEHVEATLLGTALAAMNSHLAEQAVTQINRAGTGNRVQTSAPSDVFQTKDGHILVHTVGNGLFRRWAKMVGQPELAEDPNLQTDQARGDARDRLCETMAEWCTTKTNAAALESLEKAGVPCGPVQSLQEALDSPYTQALELFEDVQIPDQDASAPVARAPIKFNGQPVNLPAAPAPLGRDSHDILQSIGMTATEIALLKESGIVN